LHHHEDDDEVGAVGMDMVSIEVPCSDTIAGEAVREEEQRWMSGVAVVMLSNVQSRARDDGGMEGG
jgi:hypothetical protein